MNTETQKTEKALAALDTMATIWAAQTNLPRLVRAVLAAPADMRQEMLTALVKQAHVEGLYEGRTSHELEPRALHEPPTFSDSVVREKGRLMHASGRSHASQWNEITHLAAEFGRASYLKGWRAAERAHNKNQKENP